MVAVGLHEDGAGPAEHHGHTDAVLAHDADEDVRDLLGARKRHREQGDGDGGVVGDAPVTRAGRGDLATRLTASSRWLGRPTTSITASTVA